jgi:membrane protein DedA with SNARE-associated domain
LGGFLAFEGKLDLWLVILVGWVASYLGTLPFYFIGYRWHRRKINQFISKYGKYFRITAQDVETSFDRFEKYGYAFVFFGRCIPLVRTFVSFPAGSVRMNFAFFSLLSILWSFVWTAILAGTGYALGSQRQLVSGFIKQYEHMVLILWAVCVVWAIGRMYYIRRIKPS